LRYEAGLTSRRETDAWRGLGLTGDRSDGKSTTANCSRRRRSRLDRRRCRHKIYEGWRRRLAIEAAVPWNNGQRQGRFGARIGQSGCSPRRSGSSEQIVHPEAQGLSQKFLDDAERSGAALVRGGRCALDVSRTVWRKEARRPRCGCHHLARGKKNQPDDAGFFAGGVRGTRTGGAGRLLARQMPTGKRSWRISWWIRRKDWTGRPFGAFTNI